MRSSEREREPGSERGAVLLTGMMGAGKTTVGRLLAQRLGWAFIDTDARVESRCGLRVHEAFARWGERRFREIEREVLGELPDAAAVVALGGGALGRPEARSIARGKGRVVWLAARPETLLGRIPADGMRPLLADLAEPERLARLRRLCEERAVAYAEADLRVDTDESTHEEVCEAVLAGLGMQPPSPGGAGGRRGGEP